MRRTARFNPWPIILPNFINDLPTIVNKDTSMVLFADDTSIIATDTNLRDFHIKANQMFQNVNTWFRTNLLTLNLTKTKYLEFRSKNCYNNKTHINYGQECIPHTPMNKFLGLTLDDTLSWKLHLEQVLNKICTACYALRNIKHVVPMDTLRIIYFAHIHSIISYGIIFRGSSSYANKVFILQKKLWELYQTLDQETPAGKYSKVWK